jgi:hypothetical protein
MEGTVVESIRVGVLVIVCRMRRSRRLRTGARDAPRLGGRRAARRMSRSYRERE